MSKATKTLKLVGVPDEIRTGYLPNTRRNR